MPSISMPGISIPGISLPGILMRGIPTVVSTSVSMAMSTLVPTATSIRASMWAIAMSVSVAAMFSPAEADFLYVPPGEPVAAAERAKDRATAVHRAATEKNDRAGNRAHGDHGEATTHAERSGARHADAEPLEKGGSASPWQVHAGEMLREVLDRWGGRAGVDVLVLTDRRYRLHEGRAFAGAFDEAARDLFAALSHLPHPPAGEIRPDGRTLAVMHQASLHQASLHQASPRRTGGGQ